MMAKYIGVVTGRRILLSNADNVPVELVQNDKDTTVIDFELSKIDYVTDLSQLNVAINYANIDKDTGESVTDIYTVDKTTVEGDTLKFSWTVGSNASVYAGKCIFQLVLTLTDANDVITQQWDSTKQSIEVHASLENVNVTQPKSFVDFVTQVKNSVSDALAGGIIDDHIQQIAEQYLEEHPVQVITDNTLSVAGTPADALATGTSIDSLKSDIVDLKNGRIKSVTEYPYSTDLVPNGYQTTTGQIKNDTNWYTSDYIKTSDGDTIDFVLQAHTAVGSICLYDENKVFISNITADYTGTGEQSNFSGKVEINFENKGYFRYTLYKRDNQYNVLQNVKHTNYDYYIDNIKSNVSNHEERISENENSIAVLANNTESKFLTGKTIFLAGDSRSSTDYPWTKTIMEEKTGATVLNQGWSGATIAQLASDQYYQRLENNPHDYCIVFVGGNDTGASGTIGTFASDTPNALLGESVVAETDINADYSGDTFVQALSHFIRKWKRDYGNWRSKANLTGSETEEEKEIKLDAVKKPVLLLCTDIPQQRVQSGYPWDNPMNQLRKNNAIRECAEKYGVHLIDLFGMCNFDMSIEPFWTSPTDKVHNNGVYYMDGLHLNKYGQDLVTSIQIEALKRYSKIY